MGQDEIGHTMVEYAVIIAVLTGTFIFSAHQISGGLTDQFLKIRVCLATAGGTGGDIGPLGATQPCIPGGGDQGQDPLD